MWHWLLWLGLRADSEEAMAVRLVAVWIVGLGLVMTWIGTALRQ